jgi:2-aminobenzoylacetyl-CoA thioesterase
MVKVRDYDLMDQNENVIAIYDKMFQLYIIKGEKNFLVDSGVTAKTAEFEEKIQRILEETGSNGKGIETLLLTHTHWDHVGSAYELQKKYGFKVIVSSYGAELLEKSKVIGFIDRLNQDYKKMLGDTSDTKFDKLQNITGVKEGDRIHVDDTSYIEVIETPGHTRCSVSYLLHPWKILFPGDSTGVLEQNGGQKPLFLSSYTAYVNSIEKLIAQDIDVLAMPHNRVIKGNENVKEHLNGALARTKSLKNQVIEYLKRGDEIPQIAEALFRLEFPKPTLLGPKEALMINFEAMIKSIRKECLENR